MREIRSGEQILAKFIPSDCWQEGLSFYSDHKDFIQVGTWQYGAGKNLLSHIHNEVERTASRTQEVLYVKKGSLLAKIFDLSGKFVEKLVVKSGDTLVLLNCGHGYEILEDDTQVLEIKNGPYLGPDIDRRRI